MIILLSPAKTLDFNRKIASSQHSEAHFIDTANTLAERMRSYTKVDLMQAMKMSEKLAELTFRRFQEWDNDDTEQVQAGAAFKGEAYNGLDMTTLNEEDLDFAQHHLRILSGMYGTLRPFDIIKPYRLEMGSKLKEESLYKVWKEILTESINLDIEKYGGPIINLASQEYFSALDSKKLKAEVITPLFKEHKNDSLKTIVVYTKKARGMMARYIIENRLSSAEDIKDFSTDKYSFNQELSEGNTLLFTR